MLPLFLPTGPPGSSTLESGADSFAACILPERLHPHLHVPSGQRLRLELAGERLASADLSGSRLRIMDECGSSGVVGTEIVSSPDGYEYDFGIITAQGGEYEVCWCIGIEPYVGCALNNHFGIRVANISLQGPTGGAICASKPRNPPSGQD